MLKTKKSYLRVREAAEILSVSSKKILSMIREGHFPATRIGGSIRIGSRDLESWLDRRTQGS